MRKLLITLVVLAALLVVADRVLVSAAENVVGRQVQVAADLDDRPEVEIRGFPFMTQAVAGEYRRIDVALGRVERDDITLASLDARVRDVRAPLAQMLRRDGSTTVRADSARASALVPYESVKEQVPDGIEVRRQGERLKLTGDVTFLGRTLAASAVGDIAVSGDQLVFTPAKVHVEGSDVPRALAERFKFAIEVGELPFGLHLTGVRVADNGVRVYAAASDLLLTGSGPVVGAPPPPLRAGTTPEM